MTEERQRESLIRNELTRLAALNGGELQPKAVVDSARSEESPLHKSFDWDDSSAAENWRLQIAKRTAQGIGCLIR